MTAPMPKDNEVDEKVVAWMLTRKRDGFIRATYNVKPTDEQIAIAEHDGDVYVPLTYAATVAELRAEIERLQFQLGLEQVRVYERDQKINMLANKADDAERRVGELEAALRDLIDVADPVALAPREYERIQEQTVRGASISIDPFPLLKCRYEDVVDLTDGLKRARATLTGADPT